jgi:hypothetical protein
MLTPFITGRYLAGAMTFEQVKEDILREFGLVND